MNKIYKGPPPLTDLLNYGLEKEEELNEENRKKGINIRFPLSPSSFGACSKKLAYALSEYMGKGLYKKERIDARSKRRFSRGHTIEYSLLNQTRRVVPAIFQTLSQQYIDMEKTPDNKYIIGGSIDSLFVTEEPMIVDIKSKGTFWSQAYTDKFTEEFKDISEMGGVIEFGNNAFWIEDIWSFWSNFPKDNFMSGYFMQLNAYGSSQWAKNYINNLYPGQKGIKVVSLWFENKNNHEMAEIRWKPCDKLYRFSLDKMQAIYKWIALDNKNPEDYPAEYTLGTLTCKLCERREECFPGQKHPWIGPSRKWAKDTFKLNNGQKLETIYKKYKESLNLKDSCEKIEQELITEIMNSKEKWSKVRFSDGRVYEVKTLKSPKPHAVLRKSK